jgi:hypothetical protein
MNIEEIELDTLAGVAQDDEAGPFSLPRLISAKRMIRFGWRVVDTSWSWTAPLEGKNVK